MDFKYCSIKFENYPNYYILSETNQPVITFGESEMGELISILLNVCRIMKSQKTVAVFEEELSRDYDGITYFFVARKLGTCIEMSLIGFTSDKKKQSEFRFDISDDFYELLKKYVMHVNHTNSGHIRLQFCSSEYD